MTPMTKLSPAALLCVLGAILCSSPHLRARPSLVTGIAHIAFRVRNLESERHFFRALGFEEAFVLSRNGQPYEVFVKINDRQFIELYPASATSGPPGWMHVCYESDDLHALYTLFTARGLQLSPVVQAGAGNLLTVFHDPDGRVVEFTQYMPGSRHSNDRGQHLGASRISTELVGIVMPTNNIDATRRLDTATLGFQPSPGTPENRLRLSSITEQWIALEQSSADTSPAFFFRVPSASRAATQLRQHGLKVTRHGKFASIEDPEGNTFVFAADQ